MNHHTHYNYSGSSGVSGKHRSRMERDAEFIKAYRHVLDLMLEMGVADARWAAVNFTIHNTHPRYYVSYDRAYLVVCSILGGKGNPVKPSLQSLMWQEIAERVNQLRASRQVSVARAVEFVLEHCRASRFFITPQYAYNHIRHIDPNLKSITSNTARS